MWKVNGQRTPSDGKISPCLWQGELKNRITAAIRVATDIIISITASLIGIEFISYIIVYDSVSHLWDLNLKYS